MTLPKATSRSAPPDIQQALGFLSFLDWRERKEHERQDWIPVAVSWREGSTDLFTFSAQVDMGRKNENVGRVLDSFDWDVRPDFGLPRFNSSGTGGRRQRINFSEGDKDKIDGVTFRPFVYHRYFHEYVPGILELVQGFLLYHEAFFEEAESTYRRIDDAGDVHEVARLYMSDGNSRLEVDAHHLRDYLAAHKTFLVRYHDHRRNTTVDIDRLLTNKFKSEDVKDENRFFQLWLRTDIPSNGWKSSSRLLGKDVILPYAKPAAHHLSWLTGIEDREYCNFLVGRDNDGQPVERASGPEYALTPVYFRREVLAKYYNEPRKYNVGDALLRCLDLWTIPIDLNSEGLVQVWLVDLGMIPYSEQQHWRQFNVEPKGGITEHRWKRDFMAEFADPKNDPVFDFWRAFRGLQEVSKAALGGELFLPLVGGDAHLAGGLRLPLTEEWKEFDEMIQSLAKITVDSLNVALLKAVAIKSGTDASEVKGSLGLLAKVSSLELPGLHAVQSLRSTGGAHRKGSKFEKAMERAGLVEMSRRDGLAKLIRGVTRDLQNVQRALSSMEESPS